MRVFYLMHFIPKYVCDSQNPKYISVGTSQVLLPVFFLRVNSEGIKWNGFAQGLKCEFSI